MEEELANMKEAHNRAVKVLRMENDTLSEKFAFSYFGSFFPFHY